MKQELDAAVRSAALNAWLAARDLEAYRRHNGAKDILADQTVMDDIERARDQLSQVFDKIRGVT
jgi:hypothetical protein